MQCLGNKYNPKLVELVERLCNKERFITFNKKKGIKTTLKSEDFISFNKNRLFQKISEN